MKQISEVVFKQIMSMMTSSLTTERLSAVLDATPDESMDVLFLGRLKSIEVIDDSELEKIVRKLVESHSDKKVNKIYDISVSICGLAKFCIRANYQYTVDDTGYRWISNPISATDDRFTSCLKFTYRD